MYVAVVGEEAVGCLEIEVVLSKLEERREWEAVES